MRSPFSPPMSAQNFLSMSIINSDFVINHLFLFYMSFLNLFVIFIDIHPRSRRPLTKNIDKCNIDTTVKIPQKTGNFQPLERVICLQHSVYAYHLVCF